MNTHVIEITTKLLSAEVENSQAILWIILPILTKFLQKSQSSRALFFKKWQNNPQNNSAIFHFCTDQQFWFVL